MRAAELVRRAEEHVAADRLHVDRLVRRVVNRVDPRERARFARELRDALRVGDRADGVRRVDARDDARSVVELALEIVEVEAQVVGDVDPVDLEAAVGGELDPRCNAAVVVEPADEDLVAFLPVA